DLHAQLPIAHRANFCSLFNRHLGSLRSMENLDTEPPRAPAQIRDIRAIRDQPAVIYKVPRLVHCRKAMHCSQFRDPPPGREELRIGKEPTLDVTKIAEPSSQRLNEVGETGRREIAKTHHALLRARRERPSCCAAEHCDELAPLHSITSSASASSRSGTLRPSAFAVFRLITSSNLVGCWTGRSDALAPLRILST